MKKDLHYTRFSDPLRIDNINEVLKLKLNNEDRFLIRNQEPLAALWRGDNESSAFYAWIANVNSNIIDADELEQMNQILQDKINREASLELVVSPFLKIIESGWYQLFYHEPFPLSDKKILNDEIYNLISTPNYNIWQEPFYQDKKSSIWVDSTIFFTQDIQSLDKKQVAFYKESILSGKRPTIVTMSLAELEFYNTEDYIGKLDKRHRASLTLEYSAECIYPQFIIDGHHKAKAYIDLGKRPSIINLTKLQLKEDFERNSWNNNFIEGIIEKKIGGKISNS